MEISEIEKMTNPKLKEYCENENIDVDSKNVSKPTKAEYVASIKKSIETDEAEVEADWLPETKEEEIVEVKETKKPKLTRSQKRKKQFNEMHAFKRVIVTSNDDSQTKINNQVNYVTWGNRLLGHQTDRVIFGKPWHVREGALRNLRETTLYKSIQDEEGNTVRTEKIPKYNIQDLTNLSQKEIDDIGKRQIIRDSSIESLI